MMGTACSRTTCPGFAGQTRAGRPLGRRSERRVAVVTVILAALRSLFSAVSQAATNPEAQAKSAFVLAIEKSALTVNLSKAPLAAVMEEFSKRSGIAVFVAPSVAAA